MMIAWQDMCIRDASNSEKRMCGPLCSWKDAVKKDIHIAEGQRDVPSECSQRSWVPMVRNRSGVYAVSDQDRMEHIHHPVSFRKHETTSRDVRPLHPPDKKDLHGGQQSGE